MPYLTHNPNNQGQAPEVDLHTETHKPLTVPASRPRYEEDAVEFERRQGGR